MGETSPYEDVLGKLFIGMHLKLIPEGYKRNLCRDYGDGLKTRDNMCKDPGAQRGLMCYALESIEHIRTDFQGKDSMINFYL